MKILALDISTSTGWSVLSPDNHLWAFGHFLLKDEKINYKEYSEESMVSMMLACSKLELEIRKLISVYLPNVVVIEQTNKGRARYTQKLLEWFQLSAIKETYADIGSYPKFIDSSRWRQIVGLKMSKEDKKHNLKIRKEGKRGKIGKKHLAVRMVNEMYPDCKFKMKDNDICDSILVGAAYLKQLEETK